MRSLLACHLFSETENAFAIVLILFVYPSA
jgi:hypothetical protein